MVKVIPGGVTRADSVRRGLQAIRSATADIVAIHDGVRPFVTVDEIEATIAAAKDSGAAILVAPAIDTIKQVDELGVVIQTLERKRLRHALTPQCFRYDLLRRAFEGIDVSDSSITDESYLVEQLGQPVTTIEASARNMKITTKADLAIAEAILTGGFWS